MSFDKFWLQYPNKKSKGHARTAWEKQLKKIFKGNEEDFLKTCLLAIDAQKREKKRLQGAGEFCPQWPMPATWLNGERWSDKVISNSDIDKRKEARFCACGDPARHGNLCDQCYSRKIDGQNGWTEKLREAYKKIPPRLEGEDYRTWAKRVFGPLAKGL